MSDGSSSAEASRKSGAEGRSRVQAGAGREDRPGRYRSETTAQVIVFFPTEKETHLGFLIQGPYRTTPARDNVPSDDDWNRDLVDATAKLIVDTLPQLKKRGLLTTAAIETLPIREDLFPEDSMFAPIFDEVLDAFRSQRLLPSHAGQFGG